MIENIDHFNFQHWIYADFYLMVFSSPNPQKQHQKEYRQNPNSDHHTNRVYRSDATKHKNPKSTKWCQQRVEYRLFGLGGVLLAHVDSVVYSCYYDDDDGEEMHDIYLYEA